MTSVTSTGTPLLTSTLATPATSTSSTQTAQALARKRRLELLRSKSNANNSSNGTKTTNVGKSLSAAPTGNENAVGTNAPAPKKIKTETNANTALPAETSASIAATAASIRKARAKPKQTKPKRKVKTNIRYDPDVPMSKEETAAWRREARRVRNRESAAASRQKTKQRMQELEAELEGWKKKFQEAEALLLQHQNRTDVNKNSNDESLNQGGGTPLCQNPLEPSNTAQVPLQLQQPAAQSQPYIPHNGPQCSAQTTASNLLTTASVSERTGASNTTSTAPNSSIPVNATTSVVLHISEEPNASNIHIETSFAPASLPLPSLLSTSSHHDFQSLQTTPTIANEEVEAEIHAKPITIENEVSKEKIESGIAPKLTTLEETDAMNIESEGIKRHGIKVENTASAQTPKTNIEQASSSIEKAVELPRVSVEDNNSGNENTENVENI